MPKRTRTASRSKHPENAKSVYSPAGGFPGREESLALARKMLLLRRFEERAGELYGEGKIRGFLHLYIGEEAVAAGAMEALTPEDAVVATYREHGQAILRGIPARAVMAEMFGKVTGTSKGHGGSMHLFDAGLRFYGGHAIVAAGIPVAVGLALADKLQSRKNCTACFFGDGAVDEGEFHESLNLASLWKLPVLFLCENNLYAMGTALWRHQANQDIADHAHSYGIPAQVVDGMDVLAVRAAVQEVATAVRKEGMPRFLELQTYRFRGHSTADPVLYRSEEEVAEWKTRDPIATFLLRLRRAGILKDQDVQDLEKSVSAEIDDAISFADAGPWESTRDLLKDVYTPPGERR